jgi:hypothetical protein
MSGQIFVHIGLPKTATTTLQTDVFPALCIEGVQYHGVFQPRNENKQNDLYTGFCEAVYDGASLEEVRSSLAGMLNAGTTIIFSEEMVTVSEEDASWRVKLKNLADILGGLDYVLILTVREPAAALFSYYVELHDQLYKEKNSFLELAKNHESMHIFHYRKLTDELFLYFDRERVFVKSFEDIAAGRLEDLCRLVTSGREGWHGFALQRHNEKKQAGNVIYTGKKVTLADVAKRAALGLGIMDAGFAAPLKRGLAPIIRHLEGVALCRKKVIRPAPEEMAQLKDHLREETAALERHFGIRYE